MDQSSQNIYGVSGIALTEYPIFIIGGTAAAERGVRIAQIRERAPDHSVSLHRKSPRTQTKTCKNKPTTNERM